MHQQKPLQDQITPIIALFSSGQTQEALDAVEALIKDYPNESLLFNISGACYAGLGKFNAAVKLYEKAIAIKPDYSKAHFNLGATLQELGQLDTAVKSYEKALVIEPDYAEAHNNLGIALKELEQLDAAVKSFKKAIAIKPDYVEAHYSLGITLQELDQLDEAVKSYEAVLVIRPDFAKIHNNLGVVFQKLGQINEAVNRFQKAVAIQSNFTDAYYNLGNAFKELGQLNEAVKVFEKALAINPNYAEAHNNLGVALHDLGQLDEAVKCYEKALSIKPDYANAYNNLGGAFHDLRQLDAAVKSYENAIAVKPDYTEAYRNLSYLKKYTVDDPQIAQMQSLLSTNDLSQSDRINLCLALAKVNENLENQDKFFKFLNEGNRLRKEELDYSLDKDQNLFSIVKKMFRSPPSLSYEPSTTQLIFIVGMPRSGTTLVEQIISSHNVVYGAGELTTLADLIEPILKDDLTHNKNDLTEKAFLSIRQQYLDALSVFNAPENVITDKMHLNFRFIGFILSAFPEAKIVHIKRDARAICWSNYKVFFTNKDNGYAHNLDDLAGFYGLYIDLMNFWHQTFPDKIYDLCYEDLTTNQEEETRKLLQYCELDWDENCLNFHKNKRAVKTASSLQVRQKMYQGSSEAWKKHEAYLEPLIKNLSSF